jgi:hypothetical protein
MHVGGKLRGRAAIAAAAQPGKPGRLGVLTDSISKVIYLIDTGAVYSVIPHKSSEPASGPAITAADGTAIPCWGWRTVTITAAGKTFTWRFLLAAVAFALIGSDFLAHFDLQVDLRRLRLVKRRGGTIKLQEPTQGYVCTVWHTPGGGSGSACGLLSFSSGLLCSFGSPLLSTVGSPLLFTVGSPLYLYTIDPGSGQPVAGGGGSSLGFTRLCWPSSRVSGGG